MKELYKHSLLKSNLFVLLIMMISQVFGGNEGSYPVTATAQMIGPHSVYLADYYGQKSEDFILNLTFNDPVESQWQVKLKLTILNNGEPILETRDNFLPQSITLTQFSTEVLTGLDLAEYFYINNLKPVGNFNYRGQLPEGYNQFCIEVVDYYNPELVISNQACAGGYFLLYDPPLLQLPANEVSIYSTETQNVLFSWLPLHLSSPNPITDIEYEFTLVKTGSLNANDAIRSAMPVYQTTTTTSTLMYTDGEPLLEEGEEYAWRVRAYEAFGGKNSKFSNNGYSEVFSFKYEQPRFSKDALTAEDCQSSCLADIPTNADLIDELEANQVVKLGLFDMTIVEITGQNGSFFTGKGSVWIPVLLSNMSVDFEGLAVNTDSVVFGGRVTTTQESTLLTDDMTRIDNADMRMSAEEATALEAYVNENKRKVSDIANFSSPVGLPISLDKEINGLEYNVMITSIDFDISGAVINAAFSMEDPETGKRAIFGGKGICIQPYGIGAATSPTLYLLEDFDLGEYSEFPLVFKAPNDETEGTFISFNCNGFDMLSIDGEMEFDRNLLVPQDEQEESVKARFTIQTPQWGEFIAKIDMDDFAVNGVDGFGFQIQEAYLDYSVSTNIEDIAFPEDYPNTGDDWKGFYMKRMAMSLPEDLTSSTSDELTVSANDVLIDNTGFTGKVAGENILTLDKGKLGDWAFSVDEVSISLVSNSFTEGGINGVVNLPMTDTTDALTYEALFIKEDSSLALQFNISPAEDLSVDVWAANLTLEATSVIGVSKNSDGINPYADLNGNISVELNMGKGGEPFSIEAIGFQGFKVNHPDEESKLTIDALSLAGVPFEALEEEEEATPEPTSDDENQEESLAGFPITLNSIDFEGAGSNATIFFDLGLNLTGSDGGGLAANTVIGITGKFDNSKRFNKWKYKSFSLEELEVDADLGAVSIYGKINMYNSDPTFGDGFNGVVIANIEPAIQVSSSVQFGKVNGYRYWYFDGLYVSNAGIGWAGIGIYGFGGGAYYHMKRVGVLEDLDMGEPSDEDAEVQELGRTLSGVRYVPNKNILLGVKAKLVIGSHPSPNAFNGDVGFEIAFQKKGNGLGVQGIYFDADGYYMTPSILKRDEAQATGSLSAEYDFNNKTFSAALTINIDAAGGVVKGGGSAQMYVNGKTKKWYVWIGTPDNPISIRLAGLARFDSYFDMGTTVPDLPKISDRIPGYSGSVKTQRPSPSMVSSGAAVIFGGFAGMDPLEFNVSCFYASAQFGLGFDLYLRKLSDGASCGNKKGSQIGIKGWYMTGQAYAYGQGSVGIKVKTFFYKGKIKILSLSASLAMVTTMPNPTWLLGEVYVKYKVLGGAVKGSFNFPFEMGTQCKSGQGNLLDGVKIITDAQPATNTKNVECYANPTFAFSVPLNTSFEVSTIDGNNIKTEQFLPVGSASISGGSKPITATVKLSSDKMSADLYLNRLMDPYTNYTVTFTVRWKKKNGNRWDWYKYEGKEVKETRTIKFKTGALPNFLPPEAVAFSIPVRNMRNFYTQNAKWFPDFYVITKQTGWGYLFKDREFEYHLKMKNLTNNSEQTAPIFFIATNSFDFIGAKNTNMRNFVNNNRNAIYQGEIVSRVKASAKKKSKTNKTTEVRKNTKDEKQELAKTKITNKAKGEVADYQIYVWNFKTSKYRHPADKVNKLRGQGRVGAYNRSVRVYVSPHRRVPIPLFRTAVGQIYAQNFGFNSSADAECFDAVDRNGYKSAGTFNISIRQAVEMPKNVSWNTRSSTVISRLNNDVYRLNADIVHRCGGVKFRWQGFKSFAYMMYYAPLWHIARPDFGANPGTYHSVGYRWTNNYRNTLTTQEINSKTPSSGFIGRYGGYRNAMNVSTNFHLQLDASKMALYTIGYLANFGVGKQGSGRNLRGCNREFYDKYIARFGVRKYYNRDLSGISFPVKSWGRTNYIKYQHH